MERKHQASTHELDRYQAALPVRLIETPRRDFVACRPDEMLGVVRARNAGEAFDYLPVCDQDERIIGVLETGMLTPCTDGERVLDHYVPISERLLIGADVSILDFLSDADQRPFRFLVTTDGISGLVSLSDIQRLPVRAALFAIVTQFEMAMTRLVEVTFSADTWLSHLTQRRQEKIEQERAKASQDRNQVARLLYTQFCDKTALVRRIAQDRGVARSRKDLDREFKRFEDLRNRLAHANVFGVTRNDANHIVETIRLIRFWLEWMEQALQDIETTQ